MDINDLIKSRLQEIPSNIQPLNSLQSKNGFAIPKLNLPIFGSSNTPPSSSLEISLQKIKDAGSGKSNGIDQVITEKLEELVLSPETKSIDLTAALNTIDAVKPSPRRRTKDVVPDLDVYEKSPSLVVEFCEPDISKFKYEQYCCAPSTFGKITCIRYRRYSTKRITVDHSFHPKHTINKFNFKTKSPDDIVISKNSKIKL